MNALVRNLSFAAAAWMLTSEYSSFIVQSVFRFRLLLM